MMALACGTMLGIGAASAQTFETNLTFDVDTAVPDGNLNGLTLATTLTFAPGISTISSVTVGLDISGGYNGDLYAYLAGPDGGFAILLDRVGVSNNASAFGYSDSGMNVTFSDAAANSIQYYQNYTNPAGGMLYGTWQPEGVNIDPLTNDPTAFFRSGQTATLSSLDGNGANGVWTLFVADVSEGGVSTVQNWSLDIITVPEPDTWAVGALAVFVLGVVRIKSARRI